MSASVVVDRLDALLLRLALHRRGGVGVDAVHHQHGDAVGDHLVGDGLEPLGVALGVLDVVLHAGRLERLLQVRAVEALVADRGLGVREDHADLALGRLGRGFAGVVPARGERERRRRGDGGEAEDPLAHLHGSFLGGRPRRRGRG